MPTRSRPHMAQYPAHTNPPGGIEKYYRDDVIGGPGSFVMVAEDYNSFGRAMVKKLIAEIATAPAELRSASVEGSAISFFTMAWPNEL